MLKSSEAFGAMLVVLSIFDFGDGQWNRPPSRDDEQGHIRYTHQRPSQVTHYVENGHYDSNPTTGLQATQSGSGCTAPSFENGVQFTVEQCQQQVNHRLCQGESSRALAGWTGVISCSFRGSSLKYYSTCSKNGDWNPPFYTSCGELFQASLLTSQNTSSGEVDPSKTKAVAPYSYPPATRNHNDGVACIKIKVSNDARFVFTCKFPEQPELEVPECSSDFRVKSGTKAILDCKLPYVSRTGQPNIWVCENGKWTGESHQLVCVASNSRLDVKRPVEQIPPPYPPPRAAVQPGNLSLFRLPVLPPPRPAPTPTLSPPTIPARTVTTPTLPPPTMPARTVATPTLPPLIVSIPVRATPAPTLPPLTIPARTATTSRFPTPARTATVPTQTFPPPTVSAVTSQNKIHFYIPQIDIRGINELSQASQVTTPRATYVPTSTFAPPGNPIRIAPPQVSQAANQDTTKSKTNAIPSRQVTCPPLLHRSPGIKIECTFRNKYVQTSSCEDPVPVGSEARYSCKDFYETTAGLLTLFRKCKQDGTWTGNGDQYGCVVQCGRSHVVRTPYITSGTPSVRGQWPWHAGLFYSDGSVSSLKWEYICGGTLIGHRAILTAAHCVTHSETTEIRSRSSLRIDLGKYYREEVDEFVQTHEIQKILVHPSYSPYGYDSDIALVILKDSVKVGYHVRPICYPQTSDSGVEELQLSEKSVGTVVGWGKDGTGNLADKLHVAALPVVRPRACLENVQESLATQLQTRSTTYCAGFTNGTNVCNGDSGGGMYFPFKNSDSTRWYLQGIVSVGIPDKDGNCDPTKYSVYTRVGRYADWIVRQITEYSA